MRCMLVHDPSCKTSIASLESLAGSVRDPKKLQGLANLCQSMIMNSSSKFPVQGTFQSLLSEQKGKYLQTITENSSNFSFKVANQHFEQFLEMFSTYFKEPLFSKKAFNKEIAAIDAQYQKNLQMEDKKLFQFEKSVIASKSSIINKLQNGNMNSLKSQRIIDATREFYNEYYSSNTMSLSLVSGLDLDQLQKITENLFNGLKNKNFEIPDYSQENIFDRTTSLGHIFTVIQEIQTNKLIIKWPCLPDTRPYWRNQPLNFIGQVLSQKGQNTLLQELIQKNLATEIICKSAGRLNNSQACFSVTVELTDQGAQDYNQVIEIIYNKINNMKTSEIQTGMFNQIQQQMQQSFESADSVNAYQEAKQLSKSLLLWQGCKPNYAFYECPLEEILFKDFNLSEQRNDIVKNYLQELKPQQAYYVLVRKSNQNFDAKVETDKLSGIKYSKQKQSEQWFSSMSRTGSKYKSKSQAFQQKRSYSTTVQKSYDNPLNSLRDLMKTKEIDAYVLFHNDAHNSEYIAACDERVKFMSGFSGSNGLCVVTQSEANMWTDGRYFLQAQHELTEGWTMKKMGQGHVKWYDWLQSNSKDATVGWDFGQECNSLAKSILQKSEINVKDVGNLVDQIWGEKRPNRPKQKLKILDIQYCGLNIQEKLNKVQDKLKDLDYFLITALDEIAWMLNLRGSDIPYNPVFFSYLLIDLNQKTFRLYIDQSKVSHLYSYLNDNNIKTFPYEQIYDDLDIFTTKNKRIGTNNRKCNQKLLSKISKEQTISEFELDIVEKLKALKTKQEQEGMRKCNVRDCSAIIKYFAHVKANVQGKNKKLNEVTGAQLLEKFRKEQSPQLFQGPSFDTISGIGANGAIIHYSASKETAKELNKDQVYLLDSGGQYLDGTTDITRTVHFGVPTSFQKEAYTRVLMGNLSLEKAVWPKQSSIAGADLDVLARQYLWKAGLDYKHGTGHGVGSFLNVHEGPQAISSRNKVKLQGGMCVSNEPGYYKEGEFGIRIENVLMVQPHANSDMAKTHLMFENLTYAPYCRELIDTSLLDKMTITYINNFHEKCLKKLEPLLKNDNLAVEYLKAQCRPLEQE